MLAANEMNATLAGPALRDAATDLTRAVRFENTTSPTGPLIIWPIDTAGERIVGAAMMIDPDLDGTYDYYNYDWAAPGSPYSLFGLAQCVSLRSDSSCERHEVRLTLNYILYCDDAADQELACHEIGHTVGCYTDPSMSLACTIPTFIRRLSMKHDVNVVTTTTEGGQ